MQIFCFLLRLSILTLGKKLIVGTEEALDETVAGLSLKPFTGVMPFSFECFWPHKKKHWLKSIRRV